MSQVDRDREHLRLLAAFHYVVAALATLFSLFPIVHLILGILMVRGRLDGDDPQAAVVGWVFVLFSAAWIVIGLAIAVSILLAARFLRRRDHYTFCLVVAGVECMLMPFGTVLGVFTLIVLLRDSVRTQFGVPADETSRAAGFSRSTERTKGDD
ncbi:MAG: hypothetical protein R3244_04800 [Thermoanaerobaculia bacterium]|nr:hypothetical protein [Thermoanaerobaculia bacterium]